MAWTRFMDMHSGGGNKIDGYEYIYIEAPEAQARAFFEARFGRDPNNVTCPCCGDDFSVDEHSSLEDATAFLRNCDWENGAYVERPRQSKWCTYELVSLDDYLKRTDILVIRADEIAGAAQ